MRRIVLAFVLSAAATAAIAKHQEAPEPDPRIGPEVDKICFGSDIRNWKEVDGVDEAVLVRRGVSDWYYLKLAGACDARVFRHAQAIGIDQRPSGGCIRRGDIIVVNDVARFTRRCPIVGIHEWNDDLPPPEEDDETEETSEQDS
jgi:hypothetical protein